MSSEPARSAEPNKELIESLKLLADNVADCIWLLDFNTGRFKYISPAVYALRGLTPEEAMQERLEDALTPESVLKMKAVAAETIPRYLAGDTGVRQEKQVHEFQQYHKDGRLIDVEISIQIVASDERDTLEIIGITRDITARKALERELLREMEAKNELIARLKASEERLTELSEALRLKNEILEKVTIMDLLTGAYNRLHFEQRAAGEIERSRRYGAPLSLMIFDLDFFKKINDQWGHGYGDAVLKRMAAEVMSVTRSTDLFARWGGEEFVILMPGTNQRHATQAAEKLRKVLSQVLHPSIGRVTASFGVAEHRYGEQLENWFARADRAMYRSKSLGRNLVTEWRDDVFLSEAAGLEWNEEWSCGNLVIDDAHKVLLDYANAIVSELRQSQSGDQIARAFDQLLAHVEAHFRDEEQILRASGYPAAMLHERFHQHLLFKGLQLRDQLAGGHAIKSDMILFLVDEIIVGHMVTEDANFIPWIRGDLSV